jgi:PAS domain S-box-containing protein
MNNYEQEFALIKKILQENPKGMTVTDISRKIKINRNSVAKYLDIMRISGHVEMITFGPAKVFFPTHRVPISNLINFTSDYIIIFDDSFKIIIINDAFLKFMNIRRKEIIGQKVPNTLNIIFNDDSELLIAMQEALSGKDFSKEYFFEGFGEKFCLKVRIKPTRFEDGKNGATIIIKNISGRINAEKILRESEKKFQKLLKK